MKPARRNETLLTAAIYKFHPDFKRAEFHVWWGDPDIDHQRATVDGGDVMPMGNGVVFFGIFTLVSGPLAEKYGRRKMLLAVTGGIFVFGLLFVPLFSGGFVGTMALLVACTLML